MFGPSTWGVSRIEDGEDHGDGRWMCSGFRLPIPRVRLDYSGVAPRLANIVQTVVERFFAWIRRNRRLWKDTEATLTSARAFLYAASVMLFVRRLGRCS